MLPETLCFSFLPFFLSIYIRAKLFNSGCSSHHWSEKQGKSDCCLCIYGLLISWMINNFWPIPTCGNWTRTCPAHLTKFTLSAVCSYDVLGGGILFYRVSVVTGKSNHIQKNRANTHPFQLPKATVICHFSGYALLSR